MYLSESTLKKLRELINEDIEYRSGRNLVSLFNEFGFDDVYENFPARCEYTDEKLRVLNNESKMKIFLEDFFSPKHFIGKKEQLKMHLDDFNEYLLFDNLGLSLKKTSVELYDVLQRENIDINNYEEIKCDLCNLQIDPDMLGVIEMRVKEIELCIKNKISLAAIFLIGSSLEGILLTYAKNNPELYNKSISSPKSSGKVITFEKWTLSDLINVSKEVGFILEDGKKFSIILRDFRNYIHPNEQIKSQFKPDSETTLLCYQTFKLILYQLQNKKKE